MQLKKDPESIPLSVGKIFHTALENYYDPEDGNSIFPIYKIELPEGMDEKNLKKVYDTARAMWNNYLEWLEETDADRGLFIEAVEKRIEVHDAHKFFGYPFPNYYGIHGYVDMLARHVHTNVPLLFEHKTTQATQSTWHQSVLFSLKWQTKFYLLGLMAMGEIHPPVDIVYNIIRRIQLSRNATPPLVWRYNNTFSVEVLENAKRAIAIRVAELARFERQVKSTPESAYPNVTRGCDSCSFRMICPSFDDGSYVEEMIEDYYEERERYSGKQSNNSK